MVRNTAREIAIHLSYELSFTDRGVDELLDDRLTAETFATLAGEDAIYAEAPNAKQAAYIESTLCGIEEKREELERYIRKYAIGWDFKRISRTARAIMLLAMYECLYVHDVPTSAAISEAVELTRKYEDEDVVSFVNGILGAFAREVAPA